MRIKKTNIPSKFQVVFPNLVIKPNSFASNHTLYMYDSYIEKFNNYYVLHRNFI